MTSREDAERELRREQRRQRIVVGKRRSRILNYVMTPICLIFFLALGAGIVSGEVNEPRDDAKIARFVKDQGGEVTKIIHPGASRGSGGPGYVDVVFDGEQSRCTYHLLDREPRSLECDPAITPASESR